MAADDLPDIGPARRYLWAVAAAAVALLGAAAVAVVYLAGFLAGDRPPAAP